MNCQDFVKMLKTMENTGLKIIGGTFLDSTKCLENLQHTEYKFIRYETNDKIYGKYVPIVNIRENVITEHFPTIRYP
jgi:hypothetical protein